MIATLRHFIGDCRGGTAIEYVLIASLVSVAIAAAATNIGTSLRDLFFGPIVDAFD